MTSAALLQRVEDAADAFLQPIEGGFDYEHGISQDEARRGALAVMVHLGVLSADEQRIVERHWKAVVRAAERRRHKRYLARRAAMTPEQREMEDSLAKSMQQTMDLMSHQILETVFTPSPLFTLMGSATDESRPQVITTSTRPGYTKAFVIEPGDAT